MNIFCKCWLNDLSSLIDSQDGFLAGSCKWCQQTVLGRRRAKYWQLDIPPVLPGDNIHPPHILRHGLLQPVLWGPHTVWSGKESAIVMDVILSLTSSQVEEWAKPHLRLLLDVFHVQHPTSIPGQLRQEEAQWWRDVQHLLPVGLPVPSGSGQSDILNWTNK